MLVGSLCSGYGGLDLAVSRVFGSRTAWHAETDPDASFVLKHHYPDIPNHGDITTVDFRHVEPVDILAAGFPCQPVSQAGQRLGTADPRWLWPSVYRAVIQMWPAYVVLENVENLAFAGKGALLAGILDDLHDAGYRARWTLLGACAVGSCHHRHRFFLVAEHVLGAPERVVVAKCGAPRRKALLLPTPMADERRGRATSPESAARAAALDSRRLKLDERIALLPTPTATDAKGGSTRLTHKGGNPTLLGAVMPLLPTPRASDARKGSPNQRGRAGDLMLPSAVMKMLPTPRASDVGTPGRRASEGFRPPLSQVVLDRYTYSFAEYAPAVALWADIHGEPPAPTEPNRNGAMRLSPAFAEWMMGLPPGWVTDHVSRVPALRAIGNGVLPLQAATAIQACLAR